MKILLHFFVFNYLDFFKYDCNIALIVCCVTKHCFESSPGDSTCLVIQVFAIHHNLLLQTCMNLFHIFYSCL